LEINGSEVKANCSINYSAEKGVEFFVYSINIYSINIFFNQSIVEII